jgi:hypothetical protein
MVTLIVHLLLNNASVLVVLNGYYVCNTRSSFTIMNNFVLQIGQLARDLQPAFSSKLGICTCRTIVA